MSFIIINIFSYTVGYFTTSLFTEIRFFPALFAFFPSRFRCENKKNSISDTFVVLFHSRINSFLTMRCVCMINLSNIFVKITASKVNKSDLLKCSPQNIWRLLKFKSLHGNEAKARKKIWLGWDSLNFGCDLHFPFFLFAFFSKFLRDNLNFFSSV